MYNILLYSRFLCQLDEVCRAQHLNKMSSSSHPDAPPYSQASSSNAQQSCQPQNDFPRQLPGLGSGQLQTQYVDHSGLQQSFEDTQQTPHSSQALSMGVDISGIQMSFLTAQDQDELEGYFKSVIGDQESLDGLFIEFF